MQKYKKPLYNKALLGVEQVAPDFVIPVIETIIKGAFTRDKDGIWLNALTLKEDTNYTKIYTMPDNRKIVAGLAPNTAKLLFWIMFDLKNGADFWLNEERYLLESGVDKRTFKTAVEELIRYGMINPTRVKEVYRANPEFFFNGNRVKHYRKNVKITRSNN